MSFWEQRGRVWHTIYHETHHNLPLDMGVASGNLILLRGPLLIDPKNVDDLAIHFPYQTEFL
jgi:hypothetical protein